MSESIQRLIYAVFARGRLGLDLDFLAAYSSRENAQALIDEQDEPLRECLVIREVELDRHPSDSYWKTPQGLGAASHLLAGLPEDAVPSERVKLGTLMTSIALEAGGLTDAKAQQFVSRDRIAEAKDAAPRVDAGQFRRDVDSLVDHGQRAHSATAELLLRVLDRGSRDVVKGKTSPAADVMARLRARLNSADAQGQLERLLAAGGHADVPPIAGSDVAMDLQLVLAAAEALSGDREKAQAWIDLPLPDYDNLTARQLVDRGRADTVLAHIAQIQSGSSG